jgi:hypothetical protein
MPRQVVTRSMEGQDAKDLGLAMGLMRSALRGDVIAVVLHDREGVCIIPRPIGGLDVIKILAETDWPRLVRFAEEHCQ